MDFQDLNAFTAHMARLIGRVEREIHHHVAQAAVLIEADAKARIGTYQAAVGPFAAWAPLAESTLEGGFAPSGQRYPGKIELGYAPPDNPLLRDGELRDSIHHSADGNKMAVGSDLDNAVWQEMGTVNMPPRSFLAGAAAHHGEHIAAQVGHEVALVLAGLKL